MSRQPSTRDAVRAVLWDAFPGATTNQINRAEKNILREVATRIEQQTRYALHGDDAHPGWDCLAPVADGPWVRLTDVLAVLGVLRDASSEPPRLDVGGAGIRTDAEGRSLPTHDQPGSTS